MTELKARQITKHKAYNAVDRDNFPAMIDVDRYLDRSGDFDHIISATDSHFWDPLDAKYIDFSEPFDLENEAMLPEKMLPELSMGVCDGLTEKQRIKLINDTAHWSLSGILHGEQGALSLSASLCHILKDQGAQEYASNQVREEARHVTAFSLYIQSRWGKPLPVSDTLGALLNEIVLAPEVYKKIVGMQLLVEGLAMGAFATFYTQSADPLLRRLCQLVMTDEAFHHKFGKIWANATMPKLDDEEHDLIEDWAAHCFQALLFNLVNPEQKRLIYQNVGLDWREVQKEYLVAFTDDHRRERMANGADIFRVLTKTLLKADIITDRTRGFYATYLDLDELKAEGDRMIGDDIADEGIAYLEEINFRDNPNIATAAAE